MKTLTQKLSLFLALVLLSGSANAQSRVSEKSKSNFSSASSAPDKMLLDEIMFEDVSVRDVVEYLRNERVTSGLNFIVAEEIAEEPINLQLRRVTFEQLIAAVEIATAGSVVIEAVAGAGNLYHVKPGKEIQPQAEPVLSVFNLSKFLAGKKDEDAAKSLEELHQTVDIAFEMLANAQRAAGKRSGMRQKVESKFHPGTKLMIVIGTPDDVEVFREVVGQLTGTIRSRSQMGGAFGGMGSGDDAFGFDGGGGAPAKRNRNNFGGDDFGGGAGGLGALKIRR
ncbi:MAG: hypothetical protein ACPGVU_23400 [Limisphaerales bacterium]